MEQVAVELGKPPATVVLFAYDERPWLNCVRSLIATKANWPDLMVWDTSKDALITRTRSREATRFLEHGLGDVLVMIDHDIGWQPGDLEHLVAMCLDRRGIVAGVYPKRGFGAGIASRLPAGVSLTIGMDAIQEVDYAATGFMAIHRCVLEALAETLPMTIHEFRPFFEIRNEVREDGRVEGLSEDWDFCRKAIDAGFSVWLDMRPRLSHMGTHAYRVEDTAWAPPAGEAMVTLHGLDESAAVDVRDCDGGPMRLFIDPDDAVISGTLLRGGTHDPEVITALRENVRLDDLVFELGANIGYHTLQIEWLVPEGRVIAVEALSRQADLLARSVREFAGGRIAVHRGAVADDYRDMFMYRDTRNPGSSYLAASGEPVTAVPLAHLVDRYGQPDVIKVDIEGAEGLAFGTPEAQDILRRTRYIVTEYCEDQLRQVSGISGAEYIALLESCGFVRDFELSQLPTGRAYCNIGMRNASVE